MRLTDAETLATSLMAEHGLTDLGWQFQFDGAKRRFGICYQSKKLIGLSRHLVQLNDEAEVRDTILHEIAHALVYIRFWRETGHGATWKAVARSIGCNPTRCYDETVARPQHNYVGTCPNCGNTIHRLRRRQIACAKCCNRYNRGVYADEFAFVWSEPEVETLRISL